MTQSPFRALRLVLIRWLMPRGYALWTWGDETGDMPVLSREPK